ncbi:RNA polymerase factor sigma-54 [Comamonas sp. B21-038]|uniref:RNA polymerase factor sigma-54 n=1 Tax=Comamonas sp. B21-038 TaxID=2918299 RepID=UPI001EFACF62|nr:RNA polymerase factor sigma-54 [Comamonas sp. B21-038]ULR89143.1 RNA polymerase factor sigma-54 [Comamonas sp. B21-038]
MMPSLSLRVSQNLTLTPQLQQSIRLLQLSTQELTQEVEQMLDENPFLEREGDDAPESEPGKDAAESAESAESTEAADAADKVADAVTDPGNTSDFEPGASDLPLDFGAGKETGVDAEAAAGDSASDWEEWGGELPARASAGDDDDETPMSDRRSEHLSLQDVLHRQALSLRLCQEDRAALYFLIESLNDDGYLEETLAELAQSFGDASDPERYEALLHHLTVALRLLQSLEPIGVGARNLSECMQLQIKAQQRLLDEEGSDTPEADALALETALLVCQESLDLLARRDVRKLMQLTGCNEAAVRSALGLIAKLEPRPGRPYADVDRNAIIPDVIVRASNERGLPVPGFSVQLNAEVMPRLRVQDVYANALRSHKGSEGHGALQQRLQEARWFIKNIQQRFDTILRVSQAIVERQRNFFVHGELAMRPMVLREIADELGLHESTISRVTTAKYMATPQGTFELKYFFGSGLGTETGGSASSTAVKALIKQLLDEESAKKPLSDAKIADLLQAQGIECARRTVAKYREAMRIPPASLRKAL